MVDPSYSNRFSNLFGGSWSLPDAADIPIDKGFYSQNVAFVPGQVSTRLGFSLAFDADEAITAMYNWISSLGNNLIWYRSSDRSLQLIDIAAATPAASTVIAGDLLGYAAIFADAGARLIIAFFNANGTGASGARTLTFQTSGYVSDLCFLPPITYTPSAPTETGAGFITAGAHSFGYRIEYRTGFLTRPSPDSGVGNPSSATFQPVAFTATGGQNASWTLNTTWPDGAIAVHVMMTPVANPAQYFLVPGASADVAGGSLQSVTIDVSISDDDLFATGIDASLSLFLMTNTTANVPQIIPSVVVPHGNRMTYITTVTDNVGNQSGAVFISTQGAYQEITPDTSLIQLPGLKDITTAISLDGTYYMFGPQWTYRTIDNGAEPSTWPAPLLVDGRHGTLAKRGAVVAPSGTYAWVASQDGLYFFQGSFQALPISYYQQPYWDRINWDNSAIVDIKDDPSVKKVYVLCELGDAPTIDIVSDTAGVYLLTWDYTNGFSPEAVQFSVDFLQSYEIGAIEVVKNGLVSQSAGVAQRKELWLGSSEQAPILRRNQYNDLAPYLDNTMPIHALYETSLFPHLGEGRGEVFQHHGADYRVKGVGPVQITAYTLDHADEWVEELIQLSTKPGEIPHRGFDLISEGVSHRINQGNNLICDAGFESGAGCP